VQEIKDKDNKVPGLFLDAINNASDDYAMVVSPRTGQQDDDHDSREQYAFYYRNSVLEPVDDAQLFDDAERDLFQREPFLARFRVKGAPFSFVLITIHTAPERAVDEIASLHDVVTWARTVYAQEDDFIVLGDFNAGCSYASSQSLAPLDIRGTGYEWIVPDEADTNLASSQCPYDRIVVTTGTVEDYTGRWNVDTTFAEKAVSDHHPVWAEFYTGHDTGNE